MSHTSGATSLFEGLSSFLRPQPGKPTISQMQRLSEQNNEVHDLTHGDDDDDDGEVATPTFTYPPNAAAKDGPVEVFLRDLECCRPGVYLNDNAINFRLRKVAEELRKNDPHRSSLFVWFNSFLYAKINDDVTEQDAACRETAKRWAPQDLFQKPYVIVPVHNGSNHWTLAVVCNGKAPFILHMNSLSSALFDGGDGSLGESVADRLRAYLSSLPGAPRRAFDERSMPLVELTKFPQQPNHCDCGLFMLTAAEFFVFGAPASGLLANQAREGCVRNSPFPGFLSKDWFSAANAVALRKVLHNDLSALVGRQPPFANVSYLPPNLYYPLAADAVVKSAMAAAERQQRSKGLL